LKPAVRPAEAAGLVLIRQSAAAGAGAEVLLGRRSGSSRFMPGIYVFPGGRVGPEDRRPSGFAEPLPDQPPGLDRGTERRLAVFARAALRETFEETGLLLGTVVAASAPPPLRDTGTAVWNAFASLGLAPAFARMRLVARAITPADSPVRFHNRFFLADGATATGEIGGDSELEDIHWAPLESLRGLPMADITLLVLEEALAHRAGTGGPDRPAPLFRWIGSKQHPWDLEHLPHPRA
jgi:8-oxo-dGTP pyrophosphatase MutT (NUDIX family)